MAWKQPSFKESVTAHWPSIFALKYERVLNKLPKSRFASLNRCRGRGAFSDRYKLNCKDRFIVDQRSENVGISNEKTGEIPVHRKSKVSVRSDHPLRVSRHLSRGQLE